MTHTLQRGIDLMAELIRIQNHWNQVTQREIAHDNHEIWQILNTVSNSDWQEILAVLDILVHQQHHWLRPHQERAFEQCVDCLYRNQDRRARVLDRRENKRLAWSMTMILREVYNDITDHVWQVRHAEPA